VLTPLPVCFVTFGWVRAKLKNLAEEHKNAIDRASSDRGDYEETKRLVETQGQLLSTKQALEQLKVAHTELVDDCNAARASLLRELLEDLGGASDERGHMEEVSGAHSALLRVAGKEAEESAVAKKARRAIDCVQGGGKTLDPSKYQFVKIAELVRLRVDKTERECQRLIGEAKAQAAKEGSVGATRVIPTGPSTSTGLMSATRARLPKAPGEDGGSGMDGAAMVASLQAELDSVAARNKRLEQRVGSLEAELRDALSSSDDLVVLKAKSLQLLVSEHALPPLLPPGYPHVCFCFVFSLAALGRRGKRARRTSGCRPRPRPSWPTARFWRSRST